MSFQKPALTYEQQIELLESRGLTILDEAFTKHCLAHFNYYRLSAYRRPFTEPGNYDRFRAGVTFDDLWALYCFDRKLRGLVTEGTKSVEISVRSRWAYEIGHHYGPLAYENPANFNNLKIHKETLERIDRELVRTRDESGRAKSDSNAGCGRQHGKRDAPRAPLRMPPQHTLHPRRRRG